MTNTTNTTTRTRIGVSYHGRGKETFYKAVGTFEHGGRTLINWVQITEAEAMAHFDGKTPFEDLSTF